MTARDSMTRRTYPSPARFLRPGVPGIAFSILMVSVSSCLTPAHPPAKVPSAAVEVPYESMSAAIAVGRPQDALQSYENALAEKPQSITTWILHARLLMISGRLADAREEFDRVLAVEPRNTDALYDLSVVAGLQGRAEEQETLLRRVVDIDGGHADALASLGERALESGDMTAARALFERALARQPAHLAALLGQGTVLSRVNDWKTALVLYDRAVDAQPDYPFAYIDRGKARQALDDMAGALKDFSRAIELAPDYPWSYIDRGKISLRQSRRQEAIADFSIAITLDPEQFEAYALRAGALSEGGNTDAAIADWERVVILVPGYWYAYAPLAALEWTKGEWAKARAALLRAYEFQEDEHSLALCAALCAIRQGKQKDAAAILQRVLSSVPVDSWYRDIARFLLDKNSESALLSRIDRERNAALKARMLFYVAVAYLGGGMERAGSTYLVQIGGRGSPLAIETQFAAIELERITPAHGK